MPVATKEVEVVFDLPQEEAVDKLRSSENTKKSQDTTRGFLDY